jgi:hypothetical protein
MSSKSFNVNDYKTIKAYVAAKVIDDKGRTSLTAKKLIDRFSLTTKRALYVLANQHDIIVDTDLNTVYLLNYKVNASLPTPVEDFYKTYYNTNIVDHNITNFAQAYVRHLSKP